MEVAILYSIGFMFFGISIGFIIGTEYIPHQLKKKNKKMIDKISILIEQTKK